MSTPQALNRPPTPRIPSEILLTHILHMTLCNTIARATSLPRPFNVSLLIHRREQLLRHEPFFDRTHLPEELLPRVRPSRIPYTDMVVLLAKLIRVLTRQMAGPLTEAERAERVAVRNEAMVQPFFDRERPAGRNPFLDDLVEDEGCFV